MGTNSNGMSLAVREHIASGRPITRLEAMIFYGVANLPDVIKEMRREGWIVQSRRIAYAAAVVRVNEHAVLQPPRNLPTREILLTEYWVDR